MRTEVLRFGQHVFGMVGFLIVFVLAAAFLTQRDEPVASSMQIC